MNTITTARSLSRPKALGVLLLSLLLLVGAASGALAQQAAEGGSPAELVAGMVAFDRAYIPVLALSNQNKPDASLRAMTVLDDQWLSFSRKFAARYPEAGWKQGVERTGAVLAASRALLKKGDLAGAHAALEEVRDIWVRLRESVSIPYYVDYLNRYHESMEEVTAVTSGRTPATLGEAQIEQLRSLLPEARRRWEAAVGADFDASMYGFSAARVESLRTAEQAVLQGIGQVAQALLKGDREVIIRTVEAMKPAFTKTFLMFGDFERVGG
jgi:hypothetical protein